MSNVFYGSAELHWFLQKRQDPKGPDSEMVQTSVPASSEGGRVLSKTTSNIFHFQGQFNQMNVHK